MPRIEAQDRDDAGPFEPVFRQVEELMGFLPNSLLTMTRVADLLPAFVALSKTVLGGDGAVAAPLKQLVAHMASNVSGCRYCSAHTGHSAHRLGVDAEKLAAIWEFESSPLFDDAERAALALARDAASVPNAVTDAQFETLREHYSEEEILELVAVIALFGFLNRWNDTLATELESSPLGFGRDHLAAAGWSAGKHG